jgi:hypothetical protein
MFKQLLAAAIFLSVGAAHAGLYRYSYVFSDGQTVGGSFSATVNGDYLSGFSNISAAIDGEEFFGNGSLVNYGFEPGTGYQVLGEGVATISGTYGSFVFAADPEISNNTNFFRMETDYLTGIVSVTATKIGGGVYLYAWDSENYDPSRWSVTAVTAVPEPESLALFMAGLGLMGVVARRRKAMS